jgi:hypothetical protein
MMRVLARSFSNAKDDKLDDQKHFNAWFDSLPVAQYGGAQQCTVYTIPVRRYCI